LKANKVNLFVSSVFFVFWYHSPNFLDTQHAAPTHCSNILQWGATEKSDDFQYNGTLKPSGFLPHPITHNKHVYS
jgi:hypothetical protein